MDYYVLFHDECMGKTGNFLSFKIVKNEKYWGFNIQKQSNEKIVIANVPLNNFVHIFYVKIGQDEEHIS